MSETITVTPDDIKAANEVLKGVDDTKLISWVRETLLKQGNGSREKGVITVHNPETGETFKVPVTQIGAREYDELTRKPIEHAVKDLQETDAATNQSWRNPEN
ncbi:hypothetical protein EOL73_03435 [Candidatus Saccharibacteria bacterium]|nr:hypothetical protein [Candidatus Saccharibacteria bacterium]NCU40783.1 hypothetical protein [Candidatus Saccharibacteria bacterium]